jgi:hypothetical protein
MHLLLPPLAIVAFDVPHVVTFFIPIAGIILAGVITVTAMYFKHQRERQWHETARLALEKGQPIPVPPPAGAYGSGVILQRDPHGRPAPQDDISPHDVRGGLVLVGTGIGLWLMLAAIDERLRFIGAIPGCIGLALLLYAAGRAVFSRKTNDSDRRPPQS